MIRLRACIGAAAAAIGFVVFAAGGRALAANPAVPIGKPVITAADRRAALRAIESTIEKSYVFPELRPALLAALERAEQSHRYDVDDPDLFAQRVTEDLRAISHDGHLYLDSDPAEYAAALAPPRSAGGIDARRRTEAERDHSGLTKMDILPGNIRYLKITGFEWIPGMTAAAYDDALRFLKGGDAIIIDLRENGGGNSDAADYLLGAIIAPGTVLYIFCDGVSVSQSRAHEHPVAGRISARPLYVLVDGHVASAAEAVAYAVQQEQAGTIVGSTTYGAANNNKKFPIAPRFILSVSYGRPIQPITRTNWEGVGVKPDIEAPCAQALDAAELAALDRLASAPGVTPETLAEYRWARVGVVARLHPVTVDRARLQGLAGNYGTITLRLTEAGLRLFRSDRPRWQQGLLLNPITEDGVFAVESFDDLRARLTGTAMELLHGSEAAREVFPRSDADAKAAAP